MTFPSYPEYKDSGVEWQGAVPAEWPRSALKYLADYQNGYPFKPEDWGEEGLPIIRISQLTGDTPPNYYSGELDCRVKVGDGDLLFSWSATIDSFIWAGGAAWLNQHIFKVSPTPEADQKFLFYLIKLVAPKLADFDAHGSTMRHIKKESLSERLHVPALAEQTQIARFLDHETARIDAMIEEQQRLIELLKEKRQAVISHAVTKGLDPTVPMKDSGVDWLGVGPAHWSFKQSKYLLEFVTSGSRGWAEYYSDAGDLFFRITNLTRDSIEPKLLSIQYVTPPKNAEGERSKVRCGDILISITADLGSVCVATNEVAGSYVSQHVALARPIEKKVFSRWLAYFVLSDACKDQLVGAGYGGTKVQLSLDDIRSFWVSMPPYEEQVLLAAFLDREIRAFDELIAQATIGMGLLSERRSALISAAVTGKIDVRDWQPPTRAGAPELEEVEVV